MLTKLIPSDNCYGWSPTIPRMVNHQPNDGHQPEQQEPHVNFLGRSSTRTRGRIRDKGQGIRPKWSSTLKTKSC